MTCMLSATTMAVCKVGITQVSLAMPLCAQQPLAVGLGSSQSLKMSPELVFLEGQNFPHSLWLVCHPQHTGDKRDSAQSSEKLVFT